MAEVWDDTLRDLARQIFKAGCAAVDPNAAIKNVLKFHANALEIDGETIHLDSIDEIIVLGAGKASFAMVQALQDVLGDRISRGVVVTKYGHTESHGLGKQLELLEASHPTPDENGVNATRRLLDVAASAGDRSLVLCCISGGSSALLCAPPQGITLSDKQKATRQLLACGCAVQEKNAVLKHLSLVKGGQLLRACYPARVVSMILSDVVGDPLDVIGSGPTVPDTTDFESCVKVLETYGIRDTFPKSCLEYLIQGRDGKFPETPKPGENFFQRTTTKVVAGNATAVEAATKKAESLGLRTLILSTFLEGEACEVAKFWSALAREELRHERPVGLPACIIGGGETTVTLPNSPGIGGRNQAMALSAALRLQGLEGVAFLAGATDGGDGPNHDSAGAVVCGSDIAHAVDFQLDAQAYLQACDSYTFFRKYEKAKFGRNNVMHLRDGSTGTNVADLAVLVIWPFGHAAVKQSRLSANARKLTDWLSATGLCRLCSLR